MIMAFMPMIVMRMLCMNILGGLSHRTMDEEKDTDIHHKQNTSHFQNYSRTLLFRGTDLMSLTHVITIM